FPHAIGRFDGVRPGKLVERERGSRLAVEAPDDIVVRRTKFDARDILQSYDGAVGCRAKHDVSEFLRRGEAALRANCVSEFLSGRTRSAADFSSGIYFVLALDRA